MQICALGIGPADANDWRLSHSAPARRPKPGWPPHLLFQSRLRRGHTSIRARAGSRSMQSEIAHPSEISASRGPWSDFPFADPANQRLRRAGDIRCSGEKHGRQHQPPRRRRNLAHFAADRLPIVIRSRIRIATMPVESCFAGACNGTGAFNLKTSCLISHRSLPLVFA